ncbi:hypothetical protein G4D82_12340 [Flavobacterium sp. CYK-4]|uniref:glycoside hydrolase family 19 protein n=1 Tax=Flavobacterium lotistagni TaxID=2709660 RepID=UPI001407625F|nr:glycoside hydrolase family 19 protein [Flavobacterium lotistagni]NHM08015.1 hypothetical protein [Flavobacterium lotistagni]
MAINKVKFYTEFKKHFGRFTNSQVQGFDAIINEWDRSRLSDLRWLAYMLATAWHETARTMQPIAEYGKGGSRPYGSKIKHSGVRYTTPDKLYYGRGFVQLTWYENYELMGRLLKVDLLRNPELAMNMDVAVKVMFEGMLRGASSIGDFTGKCLEQYFNANVSDPVSARRIINGTDKAQLIAEHYHKFLSCL